MKLTQLAALAVFVFTAGTAMADETLKIEKPHAFETPPTAGAGGGFMSITNMGETDDTLIAVRADFPRVELHTTEFTDDVARMKHVEEITIPAGETVALEPGGYHVMLMGIQGMPLVAGESFPATLVFEHAGEVAVTFDIVTRDMDHANHDH